MKKIELTSLLGEVPALTQDAEGQLRGGFSVIATQDGITSMNNEICVNNNVCVGNKECYNNDKCIAATPKK